MPASTVRNCQTCAVKGEDCFCSLTPEALTDLQSLGSFLSFDPGERVLHEGYAGDRVYVICKGRVKLTASSPDGRLLIVRIAGPGDVLGLAAVLKGSAHQVTAETLEPCELKTIGKAEFLAFMEKYRDASHNAALTLALDYEGAMLSARRLALSGSATSKLAHVLLDWGRMGLQHGDRSNGAMNFRMPLTHEELGNMAGLSRETVTRVLGRFRREGMVEQQDDRMILPHPKAMEARYC